MNRLEQLEENARESSKRIIEVEGQELITVAMVDDDVQVSIVAIQGLGDRGKGNFVRGFTELLRHFKARRYVLVTEAYMTASQRPFTDGTRVRDLPPDDRQDIILITACEKGEQPRLHTAVVDDTPGGRKVRPFQAMKEGSAEGRMVVSKW